MAGEDQESRTEPATGRRREQAREQGKVAQSNEVNSAAVLLAGLVALWVSGPAFWSSLQGTYRVYLSGLASSELNVSRAAAFLTNAILCAFVPLAPVLIATFAAAGLAGVAQVGLRVTSESLIPKLNQFDPIAGTMRLFSLRSLVTLGVSVLKVTAVLAVCYVTARSHLPAILALRNATIPDMAGAVSRAMFDMGLRAGLLLAVIAAIDYAYQKWQYEKDLRMTKEEVKEEHKLTEGNPTTKRRIRGAQMAMARRRMLSDVKRATMVVRNPTHFAVALRYDAAEAPAPVVLAKGADYLAERILKEARKRRVPEIHNAPVARALYKTAEVGQQIPPKLYQAVAKLLVQVYRMTGRALTPRPGAQVRHV